MAVNLEDFRDTIENGFSFCGVTAESFAIDGRRYQWPRNSRLSWCLAFDRLGNLTDMDLKGACEFIFKSIATVCQLDFTYSPNSRSANILVSLDRMDGRSGTLADMQIPMGIVNAGNTQLHGRIDIAESWDIFDGPGGGRIDYRRTQFHEMLHAMGLGHKPDSDKRPALIAPVYSENLWVLQPADIEELQMRYGARETSPPPAPAPVPVPTVPLSGFTQSIKVGVPASGKVAIDLNLGIAGKTYRATGNAIEVDG